MNNQLPAAGSSNSFGRKFGSLAPNKKITLPLIVIIIIAVAAGGWYYWVRKDSKSPQANTRAYSFDEKKSSRFMIHHLLEGSGEGTGFEFDVPGSEFLYSDGPLDKVDPRMESIKDTKDKIKDKGTDVEFGQRLFAADGTVYHQAIIAARTVPAADRSNFSKDVHYKEILNNLVFRASIKSSQLELGLGEVSSFSNKQVNGEAKIYTVSVSVPAGTKTDGPIRHMVGELVEIPGKNADYYLLIAAVFDVWDSGQKTWQTVKDSINVEL